MSSVHHLWMALIGIMLSANSSIKTIVTYIMDSRHHNQTLLESVKLWVRAERARQMCRSVAKLPFTKWKVGLSNQHIDALLSAHL